MRKKHYKSMIASAVLAGLTQVAVADDQNGPCKTLEEGNGKECTFVVKKDTWVGANGRLPDGKLDLGPFGELDTVRVQQNAPQAYFQFDVSEIPKFYKVDKAVLTLFSTTGGGADVKGTYVKGIGLGDNDQPIDWNESTLKLSNPDDVALKAKVKAEKILVSESKIVDSRTVISFDVTNELNDKNVLYNFVADHDTKQINFASKENTETGDSGQSRAPILTVTISEIPDEVAPTFAANIPVLNVNATGVSTNIAAEIAKQVDAGNISATDDRGGDVTISIDGDTKFPSGKQTVTLQAKDAAQNKSTKDITVNITPLTEISFSDQQVAAGSSNAVTVKLSGDAVAYPVTMDYAVSGDATAGTRGTLTFASLTERTINVDILASASEDEQATLTISNVAGAQQPDPVTFTVVGNAAPKVTLKLEQDGQVLDNVAQDGNGTEYLIDSTKGDVTVTAAVTDLNPADTHDISWDGSASELGADGQTFSFDPASLTSLNGSAKLVVTATETNTSDKNSAALEISFKASSVALPVLPGVDSDGDKIPDNVEGYKDSDGDGILDYLDDNADTTQLPLNKGLLQIDDPDNKQGLRLTLGSISRDAQGLEAKSANVSITDLAAYVADNNNSASAVRTGFVAVGSSKGTDFADGKDDTQLINFKVEGLANGAVATVVYPLPAGETIPEGAKLRKYTAEGKWVVFDETSGPNNIKSAAKTAGVCPPPGNGTYKEGLTKGHECIQLSIVDGGIYDFDKKTKGVVEDPAVLTLDNTAPLWQSAAITLAQQINNQGVVKKKDDEGKELAELEGQDETYTIKLSDYITDKDADALTFAILGDTNKVKDVEVVTLADGELTFDLEQITDSHTVKLSATDGNFAAVEATIKLPVRVNTAPVIEVKPLLDTRVGELYSADLAPFVSDQEMDLLSEFKMTLVKHHDNLGGTEWVRIDTDGKLIGKPTEADIGTNRVDIQVTEVLGQDENGDDILGLSSEIKTITIEVKPAEETKAGSFSTALLGLLSLVCLRRRKK